MVWLQYKKLLELRGITELQNSESVQDAIDKSGGPASLKEMKIVDESVILHYINESAEYKEAGHKIEQELKSLNVVIDDLKIRLEAKVKSTGITFLLTEQTAKALRDGEIEGWYEFSDDIYEKEDDSRCRCNTIYYNKELDKYIEISYHIAEVGPVIKPVTVYDTVGEATYF